MSDLSDFLRVTLLFLAFVYAAFRVGWWISEFRWRMMRTFVGVIAVITGVFLGWQMVAEPDSSPGILVGVLFGACIVVAIIGGDHAKDAAEPD